MKKFISMLLVISIMATTFALIFAGTVTAFAAESNAVTAEEYVPVDDTSIGAKVAAIVVWFINAFRNSSNDAGPLSYIMEAIYQAIAQRYDVEGLMEWLNESGIVEWVTRIVFPR